MADQDNTQSEKGPLRREIVVGVMTVALSGILAFATATYTTHQQLQGSKAEQQRKDLTDLQAALAAEVAAINDLYDTKLYCHNNATGSSWRDCGREESWQETARTVDILRVRPADERIRALAFEVDSLCTKVARSEDYEAGEQARDELLDKYLEANNRLGELLR
jgi:hypothetical protein